MGRYRTLRTRVVLAGSASGEHDVSPRRVPVGDDRRSLTRAGSEPCGTGTGGLVVRGHVGFGQGLQTPHQPRIQARSAAFTSPSPLMSASQTPRNMFIAFRSA